METISEQGVSAAAAPVTKRVLIVEDDKVLARLYWKKLLTAGYAAEVASDGARGLQMVREYRPDLIVLDLMMPEVNGVEVLTQLRQAPETRTLPVLVFTSQFLGDMVNQARAAGATKILAKSQTSPENLVGEIAQVIGPSARPALVIAASSLPDVVEEKFSRTAARCAQELPRLLDEFLLRGRGDLSRLMNLYQQVRALAAQAAKANHPLSAHVAAALEALLKELHDNPNAITPSAQHTVTKAIHCLVALLVLPNPPTHCDFAGVNILAVDDDLVALRLSSHALSKVKLRVECISDPLKARPILEQRTFALILLDIEMPGLTGPELCAQLRQFPANANTPVIFVTGVNQFDRREDAISQGGDDLIAKPFLPAELAVKALTRLITARD